MTDALCQAAREVGAALRRWSAEGRFAGTRLGTQFKADVDRWAHEGWCAALQRIAPGSTILSEEDEASHAAPAEGAYWVVDPLDGTASFVEGFAGWVTQAAWLEQHRPVLSVVYAPETDELFHARSGAGAYRNGQRLERIPADRPRSLIDNYPQPRGIAADLLTAFEIPRYLESGSLGLKICRVAHGHADLFVKDVPVKSWDLAPADLILAESGGRLTTLAGRPPDYAAGVTHGGLVAARHPAWTDQVADWARARAQPQLV